LPVTEYRPKIKSVPSLNAVSTKSMFIVYRFVPSACSPELSADVVLFRKIMSAVTTEELLDRKVAAPV
jgi:hypothetical protein